MQGSRTAGTQSGSMTHHGAAVALASEPELFRLLFESSPDALLVIDQHARIFRLNRQTEKLFGYDRGELMGQPVALLFPFSPSDPDVQRSTCRRKDGLEFPAEVSLRPVDPHQGAALIHCTIRNVTRKKRARESFRALLDFAPDAMVIVNPAGHISEVNARTELLFGYRREELTGQPLDILAAHQFQNAYRLHVINAFSSQGVRDSGAALEIDGLRKDGSEFPVEISLAPLQSKEGAMVACGIRDVTRRSATERAAEQLAAIVDSAEDAIVSRDLDGIILSWNPAAERMFGWMASEVVGRHISQLSVGHPDRDPKIFARIANGQRIEYYETSSPRKDGTFMEVAVTISPVKNARGVVVGYSRIFRHVTERKREKQEKEILLQEIHHRVKNNLALICSLFFLQSTYTQDPATVRILRESQDRVRSMALVHETLYRSGDFASVNFGDYVRSLAGQLLQTYRLPGQTIRLSTELEKVDMRIDRAVPCGLILNELVTNSLKHAFPDARNGEIRITLNRQADGLHFLEVADDGAGLRHDVNPRTDHSLGLRLIRSLTQQLDGVFDITNAQPGTVARLRLALTDHANAQ